MRLTLLFLKSSIPLNEKQKDNSPEKPTSHLTPRDWNFKFNATDLDVSRELNMSNPQ